MSLDNEVQDIVAKMTNFYRDNLPENSSFEKILKIYIRTISMVWSEFKHIKNNGAPETAHTLYILPYFKIDISNAMYDYETAKLIQGLSIEDTLDELNKRNLYTKMEFLKAPNRVPILYSMDLKETFNNEETLSVYEHYFIRDNRLYLLPNFVLKRERVVKHLHAFNLKINDHTLEKNWGTLFNVETGPLLPRFQYRDVVSSFQRMLSSDLMIKDIVEAIHLATEWKEFKVEDIMSHHLSEAKRRLYRDWYISPAKFLVTLPEDLIKDKLRLNILLSLLDEAKEAQTDYHVIFSILREDFLIDYISDKSFNFISMKPLDIMTPDEKTKKKISIKSQDPLFPINRYDYGRHYDYRLQYDAASTDIHDAELDNDYLTMDDENVIFDTPWMDKSEYYEVRHISFPEIPRQFSMVETADNGVYEITVRSNTDGTTGFHLLGCDEERGNYEMLGTFLNDINSPTVTFLHNANQSKKRYYKTRAIAGNSISLLTLPIDIQAI